MGKTRADISGRDSGHDSSPDSGHELKQRKAQLRRQIQMRLALINPEEKLRRVEAVCEEFCRLPALQKARTVLAYFPMESELPILTILQALSSRGTQIYLPVISINKTAGALPAGLPSPKTMTFHLWPCDDAGRLDETILTAGLFGIRQPPPDFPIWNASQTTESLVIVPGSVFTKEGDRLGLGGGFYDRFLASCPELPSFALCLREQIVDQLPREKHDVRIGRIFTC